MPRQHEGQYRDHREHAQDLDEEVALAPPRLRHPDLGATGGPSLQIGQRHRARRNGGLDRLDLPVAHQDRGSERDDEARPVLAHEEVGDLPPGQGRRHLRVGDDRRLDRGHVGGAPDPDDQSEDAEDGDRERPVAEWAAAAGEWEERARPEIPAFAARGGL